MTELERQDAVGTDDRILPAARSAQSSQTSDPPIEFVRPIAETDRNEGSGTPDAFRA